MNKNDDFNRRVDRLNHDQWAAVLKIASWLRRHPRVFVYIVLGPAGQWVLWPMIQGAHLQLSREMMSVFEFASNLGIPFVLELLRGLLRPYADRRGNLRGGLNLGHTGVTPEEADEDNRRWGG